jgi:hypothetical protein
MSNHTFVDTDSSASSGHWVYRSIVQQLMSAGNCRHLFLNMSPTGDMAKTMCNFSLTLSMKAV